MFGMHLEIMEHSGATKTT